MLFQTGNGLYRAILSSAVMTFAIQVFTVHAFATPIYQETLQGNGETRIVADRTINVSEGGRYFLTLRNGDLGPRNIEQCESEDTVSAKRECLFDNLNERIEQNFTRMRDALIHINGVRVRHSLAPSERTITQARGLIQIPVNLIQGANTLKVDYLGYSTAKLYLEFEKAPETPSPPFARFLLNRITGNTTQEFRLNAKESFSPEAGSLTYAWLWGDEPEGFVPVPSTETVVTHTYSVAGTYHAKLVVTDTASGLSSEFGIDLVVTALNPSVPPENEPPKPVIQWAVDSQNPMRVTFNASQSSDDGNDNNKINSYSWRLTSQAGQQVNLTGETLSYTFFNPGSYTVRLGVTDNLGKTAYQTRVISLAPLSELVHDEILLTKKDYFGTFETEATYTETINIPEAKLGKIRIKNADGLDHPIQDCSLIALPAKIGCLYDNLVNRTYVQLYRVSSANIYVNGRKVTDSVSVNKQKKDFETVVSLNQTNTVEVRVRGWPTAFVNVEIQALETNLPPVAIATHSTLKRGAPQAVEFQATPSTDPNDQVASFRFQAKPEGASTWTIDTDWQASGVTSLTFPSVGRWEVLTSARDKFGAVGTTQNIIEILPNNLPTLQINYGVYTNQSPYRVQVRAISTDADADTLLYNFTFSNGQTTGFQGSNTAVSLFQVSGNQSVTVTVRDENGGETVGTQNFSLGENLVPLARFSFASPRAGYAPHTISFDASASTDPDGSANDLQYFWNFGDGTTGTGINIDHTFQLGGEYIVALTVIDPQRGAGSQSRAIFSWTNEPPVPRYSVTPIPGTLQRIFDASASTPGDSAIQRYTFETGDGGFIVQTSPTYTHTYATGGVYNTSLRVYDAENDANISVQTVTVFNGQKPAANINLVAADVVTPATFVLNADNSATPNSGATINGWRWTLPNGETHFGPDLTYEINQHGNFSITLEVRDSFGFWSDPVTQEFSATSGVLPLARIEASQTLALVGEPIHFSGLMSSTLNANANLVSYEWTTPNGSKLYGPEVDIGLSQPGLKTITLVVTDSKGYVSNPASFQVNIVQPTKPIAVFTLSDGGTTIPVWRHADASESHATSPGASITGYEWRIQAPSALPNGIDFSLFGPEVDLLFDQAVTYTVSLRVFDSAGGTSDWVSETFGPLQNSKPVAYIMPGSMTVIAPATIDFSSFGSFDPDGHDIIGYYWNLGDGAERYEPSLQHQYSLPGVYTVEMAVMDSFGLWSDPIYATITVLENQLPIPVITMQDDPGGNRFKKIFSGAQSSDPDGTISEYHWFLSGSSRFASGPEIEYTFPAPGHYTMGLDVIDNKGGTAIAWYSVEIPANAPPVISAKYEVDDENPMRFLLDGSASTDDTSIASFVWRKGTDIIGTTASIQHTFSTEGVQNVSLEITDTDGTSASKDFTIYAFEGGAAGLVLHEPSQNVVEPETGVEFFASDAIPMSGWPKALILQPLHRQPSADGLSYSWRINDVEISTSQTPQIAFTNPGQTKISLVVTDGENILAKASRPIAPDLMSCGPTYLDEGIRCLTIPGVHSVISSLDGENFDIPLPEEFSTFHILKARLVSSVTESPESVVDITSIAYLSNNTLKIPKSSVSAAVASSQLLGGPLKLELSLQNDQKTEDVELPYFTLEASLLSTPTLAPDEFLILKDRSSGMHLRTITTADGTTVQIPSSDLEFQLVSQSRKVAFASASVRPGYTIALYHEQVQDSEFDRFQVAIALSTAGTTNVLNMQKATTISASATSNDLSRPEGIVAFVRTSRQTLTNLSDYKLSQDVFRGVIPFESGSLKGQLLPWNAGTVGDNPANSASTQTRHLECAAYEEAWNRTGQIEELNSRYQQFLAARRLLGFHHDRIAPWRNQLQNSTSILRGEGFAYCNINSTGFSTLDFQCMIDYLQFPELFSSTALAAMQNIRSAYPRYLLYENLLRADQLSMNSGYIAYFDFGASLGYDNNSLNSASWRKYLMPASTRYQVTARYKLPNSPTMKEISGTFSSSGLKGDYAPNILSTAAQPANVFAVPGIKTVLVPFEFPAQAMGIEFDIRPVDLIPESSLIYIGPSTALSGTILPHVSRADKLGSASCRLSPSGYRVKKIEIDIGGFAPIPTGTDARWVSDSFNSWPTIFTIPEILDLNRLSRKIERFTTYVAQSIFRSGGFVATDFDRLGSSNQNPLNAVSTDLPDHSALEIPITVIVEHPGLNAPSKLQIFGAVGNSSTLLVENNAPNTSNQTESVYRLKVPYGTISTQLGANIISDLTNPLQLDYQIRIEPIVAGTASIKSLAITLTPMLNAKYRSFTENISATGERNRYGGKISTFVKPALGQLLVALDEVTNLENDLHINDGSLPFGKSIPDHKGHDTGEMLDIRTFGVKNSLYETFNKGYASDGTDTNDDQLFDTPHNTKFKDIARLMLASYQASTYYSSNPSGFIKLKTALECAEMQSSSPGSCDPTSEITVEKCIFLETTDALANPSCQSILGNITTTGLKDAHSRYRDYIVRNREVWADFTSEVRSRFLPMPAVIYSSGEHEPSKKALLKQIGTSNITEDYKKIDSYWNIRILKQGTVPNIERTDVTSLLLSGVQTDGTPLQSDSNVPGFKYDTKSTHLDHYHITINNKEMAKQNEAGAP